jgi:hypothetical protein
VEAIQVWSRDAVNQSRNPLKFDAPASYRIRIEGCLNPRWSDSLCGMAISTERQSGEPAVTTLAGELTDMAALMGVLNTVYDLGYTLLEVERLAGSRPPASSDVEEASDDFGTH